MSMAVKYGMMKKARMANGGEMSSCSGPDCGGCSSPGCMAGGGETGAQTEGGDLDMIDRIMKRQAYSKGGEVKEEEPTAEFESNDFDVLDGEKIPTEADETGANSGDEIGDEAEDDDEKDVVSRIMKSRKKTDRMPRPA